MPTTTRTGPLVLTVVNLKGGAGKTTAAAYAAHALHELGGAVLAVDADPQGSLLKWSEAAGWPFPVVALPSGKLHRELPGIVGDRWNAVVVDTPPTEHGRAIALSAVRAASHVLIPCAPTPIEYERLRDLRVLLDDAADLRDDEFEHGVLFVKAVTSSVAPRAFRDVATAAGWRVLRPVVPEWQRYAQGFGQSIDRAAASGYGDAVVELLEEAA